MIQNDRIKERDNKAQRNKEANTKNAPMFN